MIRKKRQPARRREEVKLIEGWSEKEAKILHLFPRAEGFVGGMIHGDPWFK